MNRMVYLINSNVKIVTHGVTSTFNLLKHFKHVVYVLPVNGQDDIEESRCLQNALCVSAFATSIKCLIILICILL
jgi:hypothetical protein